MLSTCPLGWRVPWDKSVEIAKLAVETCYWPLYEVEQGRYRITYKPRKKLPIEEWLKPQGRFRHLFKSEKGKELIAELQTAVDRHWEELLMKERCTQEG